MELNHYEMMRKSRCRSSSPPVRVESSAGREKARVQLVNATGIHLSDRSCIGGIFTTYLVFPLFNNQCECSMAFMLSNYANRGFSARTDPFFHDPFHDTIHRNVTPEADVRDRLSG